jgi:hypothetical protein
MWAVYSTSLGFDDCIIWMYDINQPSITKTSTYSNLDLLHDDLIHIFRIHNLLPEYNDDELKKRLNSVEDEFFSLINRHNIGLHCLFVGNVQFTDIQLYPEIRDEFAIQLSHLFGEPNLLVLR